MEGPRRGENLSGETKRWWEILVEAPRGGENLSGETKRWWGI